MKHHLSRMKSLRRYAGRLLLAVLVAGSAVVIAACGGSSNTSKSADAASANPRGCSSLNLYTWEGEAPATLLKPFEKEYGVPVKATYMTSGAEGIAKLVAGGVKQYDVVFIGNEETQHMREAKVIKPLDLSKFTEYSKLMSFVVNGAWVNGDAQWALPIDWGVNPFIYSTEVFKTPPTSWASLWSPAMKGQVALWEDISMLYVGAAVLGYDKHPQEIFNMTKAQLDEVKKKMLELKGNVRTIWSSGGDLIQLYANHEVGASMGWGYVYNELKKKHAPVAEARIPEMGAEAWAEGASLTSDISPDCEAAAYDFLNLMDSPKGNAALAESSGYTPVNPAAVNYMTKEEIKLTGMENPRAYLGSAIFKQGVNNPALYNETMEEVIAGLK
jgi:spermidine/putrescine-binding protein